MRLDAIAVELRPLASDEEFLNPDPVDYPKDHYWLFSGCDEEWGNRHSLCPGDVPLRRGFRGHCVCGCHR